MKKRVTNLLLQAGSLGLMAVLAHSAYAAGYRLEFQSASVLADSGEAAVVEDAGTNWYNSAGLVYLPQQLVGSVMDVYSSTEFSGTTRAPSTTTPAFPSANFSAAGSVSSHPNAILPAMHYVLPFKERFAFGLSVVPAWGLLEDYGENSILRYDLTRVYTKTIDIAPSIAMKINDHLSVGLGPDIHYFMLQSKNHVRTQLLTPGDSISRFTANNWNYGGHIGVLYRFNDRTRLGLNYRSKIVMNLNGFSGLELNGVAAFESRSFKLNVPLPAVTTLSIYHELTDRLALMGTIAYDQWSVLQSYNAKHYITARGMININQPQRMRDTVDLGVGMHYKLNEQWMLRANMKYLPTPTRDQFRDVSFPDAEKLGFQIGARYQMNKKLALDMLYGHVFTRTSDINGSNLVTRATATGHVHTSMDLVGAQFVWNI